MTDEQKIRTMALLCAALSIDRAKEGSVSVNSLLENRAEKLVEYIRNGEVEPLTPKS